MLRSFIVFLSKIFSPKQAAPVATEKKTPYDIAQAEIGVKEDPSTNSNSRIIEYDSATSLKAQDDAVPWCSSFVNWCFLKAGLPRTNSALARSWLSYGTEVSEKNVKQGDVAVLLRGKDASTGHVGFVVRVNALTVEILGGNQSDMVCIKPFLKSNVISYRTYLR